MKATDSSKVVLIQPPVRDFYLTKKRTLPYGLAVIAAGIRNAGFEVEIIDALATAKSKPVQWPASFIHLKSHYSQKDITLFSLFYDFFHFGYSLEHIAGLVREKQPFIVGISSLFTAYADMALKTAEIIKTWCPETLVVMGGHHPTQFPRETLAHPSVDVVVRGEGEAGMPELCRALQNGSPLEGIPGVAFKKAGILHIPGPAWLSSLKDLPIPAFDLMNHPYYRRKKQGTAIVVSSRGCPMHCSYCAVSAASACARYRRRPVRDVLDEIRIQLSRQDIGFIEFEDENLSLSKDWFHTLFAGLIPLVKGRGIELRAMNGLFPGSLDDRTVSVMKSAGFKTLNLSLGSACCKQLKRFRRPDIRSSFESSLALAEKYGLEAVSYLIAAVPGQSPEGSLEDLVYLAGKRTLIGLSIFYQAPGSLDFQTCKDRKLLPDSFSLMRSTAFPINDTTSRAQAATLLRLSRILNFMKSLIDSGRDLPAAAPCPEGASFTPKPDRFRTSEALLKWFLHDGKIRGVTPQGKVFIHPGDTGLTKTFIEKIQAVSIRGVRN